MSFNILRDKIGNTHKALAAHQARLFYQETAPLQLFQLKTEQASLTKLPFPLK